MPTMEALAAFWTEEGLNHIIPESGEEFPEGFDVFDLLRQIIDPAKGVLEVGCGYGRLCRAFPAASYTGVDINPAAIEAAKRHNEGYRFERIAPAAALPAAGTALLYTVACYIPDEELTRFLKTVCAAAPAVVIAELMDRRWRKPATPPVFNRDPEQYVLEMANRGYLLRSFGKAVYARYNAPPWNADHDVRMTFHHYAKAGG
jgi:SAM-dependent methyltransferase